MKDSRSASHPADIESGIRLFLQEKNTGDFLRQREIELPVLVTFFENIYCRTAAEPQETAHFPIQTLNAEAFSWLMITSSLTGG